MTVFSDLGIFVRLRTRWLVCPNCRNKMLAIKGGYSIICGVCGYRHTSTHGNALSIDTRPAEKAA